MIDGAWSRVFLQAANRLIIERAALLSPPTASLRHPTSGEAGG